MKRALLVAGFFSLMLSDVSAQSKPADMFHDGDGNTFHQVFLDFQATEILEMNYPVDGTPVEGELTSDGFSVVIKNYPGDKSIKLKVVTASGEIKEITKSRCFIDPVLLHL